MRRLGVSFVVISAVLAIASVAIAGGRPFSTALTGAAEVPGPGDPDGSGQISLTINPGLERVCYDVHVENVDPVIAGHIHVGTADVAGDIVVDLMPSIDASGNGSKCVHGDRSTLVAIMANPAGYYVNLHTGPFPAGAVRGQLG